MGNRRRWSGVFGMALCAVAACSDDFDPASVEYPVPPGSIQGEDEQFSVTPEEALKCAEAAGWHCKHLQKCRPFDLEMSYESYYVCEKLYRRDCLRAITLPGTSATALQWRTCAEDSMQCSKPPSSACTAKPGQRALGDACANNAQCTSAYCRRDRGEVCGTCADPAPVGAACERWTDCASQLCVEKTCRASAKQGEACGTLPCEGHLVCDGQTCRAPTIVGEGDACDEAHLCGSDNASLSCGTTSTCQKTRLAGLGEACGSTASGEIRCRAGNLCVHSSPATGVCTAPVAPGGACNAQLSCQSGSDCLGGRCVVNGALQCGGERT